MSNDVIFFNAIVANDTALISSANNEEDMDTEASFSNSFNAAILDKASDYDLSICRLAIPSDTIDLLNITSSNAADYKIGLSFDSKANTSDTSLQRIVKLNSLPVSSGSYATDSDVYPYSYYSANDVVEAINRTMALSYYNYVSSTASYTQAESGYGFHVLGGLLSFDTATTGVLTLPTYTPNALETRVCSVVLSLSVTISSGNDPFNIVLGNANNECLVVSTSPNQAEYDELQSYMVTFAEFGLVSLGKAPNMSTTSGSVLSC